MKAKDKGMEHRARDYPTVDCGEIRLLKRVMKYGIASRTSITFKQKILNYFDSMLDVDKSFINY